MVRPLSAVDPQVEIRGAVREGAANNTTEKKTARRSSGAFPPPQSLRTFNIHPQKMDKRRTTQRSRTQNWEKALPEWRWDFLGALLSVLDHSRLLVDFVIFAPPSFHFPGLLFVSVSPLLPQVFSVLQGSISGHLFALSSHLTSCHAMCFPCHVLVPYLRRMGYSTSSPTP